MTAATLQNLESRSTIHEKADDSESYSRKDSLRISGIEYNPHDDNMALQTKIIEKLAANKVDICENDIFRLHHCGKPVPMNNLKKFMNNVNDTKVQIDENDHTKTAEIIVRFTNWRARSRVYALHHAKNLQIWVNVDVTKYRREMLAEIREHLKTNNFKAYAYINSECCIVIKTVDADQRSIIQNWSTFESLAESLTVDPEFHRRKWSD